MYMHTHTHVPTCNIYLGLLPYVVLVSGAADLRGPLSPVLDLPLSLHVSGISKFYS